MSSKIGSTFDESDKFPLFHYQIQIQVVVDRVIQIFLSVSAGNGPFLQNFNIHTHAVWIFAKFFENFEYLWDIVMHWLTVFFFNANVLLGLLLQLKTLGNITERHFVWES